jgi:ATP-dependent DNA helicase RecG
LYSNYLRFMLNTENIQSLIDSGEGYNVEFKVRVPSKVRELTEEICAFANADGGYLLVGVDDNGQVVDTNLENHYLKEVFPFTIILLNLK